MHELRTVQLTIKNVKTDYWEKIETPKNWPHKSKVFRQQLSLKIARDFYATKYNDPKYHIPYFLETVQKIAAQTQNEHFIDLTQNSDR